MCVLGEAAKRTIEKFKPRDGKSERKVQCKVYYERLHIHALYTYIQYLCAANSNRKPNVTQLYCTCIEIRLLVQCVCVLSVGALAMLNKLTYGDFGSCAAQNIGSLQL